MDSLNIIHKYYLLKYKIFFFNIMDQALLIAIFAITVLFLLKAGSQKEGLLNRPNPDEKRKIIEDVMKHKDSFLSEKFTNLKKKMPWLDNVTSEDIFKLVKNNQLTEDNIAKVVS